MWQYEVDYQVDRRPNGGDGSILDRMDDKRRQHILSVLERGVPMIVVELTLCQ